MKNLFLTFFFIIISTYHMSAQQFKYFDYIDKALKFYHEKNYQEAGKTFELAFGSLHGKSTQNNLYNSACSWSLAGNNDKTFLYLQKIIDGDMIDGWNDPIEFYQLLNKDSDFNNIKTDPRWKILTNGAKRNQESFQKNIRKDLAERIKILGKSDQEKRLQLDSLRKVKGLGFSGEKELLAIINRQDSINLIELDNIIKEFGWLGPKDIGYKNNQYLFLIVQHADLITQKKYMPLFKKAKKNGKILPKDIAYLEDRINMREEKPQQYGSQVYPDVATKKFILFPLKNVDSVDYYRASVGLESLSSYLKSSFNIGWDPTVYKKELPVLQAKFLKKTE
ncbi:DUF6624 domain-containing protein [Chryseobacterium sp. SIMBA_029]|uniref:DUF6624 domain-containing protein n=2 Tax=Pseudomonadati TaxID=3379134 RepID=UPI00397C6B4E